MSMELPKKTCISCAYLCQKAEEYYGVAPRRSLVENTNRDWYEAGYTWLVCYKERLPSFYLSGKTIDEIRNILIESKKCKNWTLFINGISPSATDQRESSKKSINYARWALLLIGFTFAVA
ncbi:MAG: hypothetical protein JSW16_04475, partial [Dehalococcoidales bacterium]